MSARDWHWRLSAVQLRQAGAARYSASLERPRSGARSAFATTQHKSVIDRDVRVLLSPRTGANARQPRPPLKLMRILGVLALSHRLAEIIL